MKCFLKLWIWKHRKKLQKAPTVKFYPKPTEFIYTGMPCVAQNCLSFEPLHKCDALIQFGDWTLELNIDSERKTIVSLEGVLSTKTFREQTFVIPPMENAAIYIDNINECGCITYPKWDRYYDKESGWMGFGEIQTPGKGYCFATNTVALIHQNELKAIFVKPRILEKIT